MSERQVPHHEDPGGSSVRIPGSNNPRSGFSRHVYDAPDFTYVPVVNGCPRTADLLREVPAVAQHIGGDGAFNPSAIIPGYRVGALAGVNILADSTHKYRAGVDRAGSPHRVNLHSNVVSYVVPGGGKQSCAGIGMGHEGNAGLGVGVYEGLEHLASQTRFTCPSSLRRALCPGDRRHHDYLDPYMRRRRA